MKTFLVAAIFTLVLLPAIAAAQGREVNIFTFEDSSCTSWTKSANNNLLRAQYLFWIQGFVSGHNYARPEHQVKTGKLPGSEALYRYLDSYCKNNPPLSFVGAAIALVEDLREPVAPAKAAPAKSAPAKKSGKDAPTAAK